MIGPTCARRIGKKRVISTGLISIILIWNVIACKAVTPSATPGPANTSTSTSVSTAILAATLTPEPARLDPVIQLEWTEKQGRINALAWSPDGRILAVASNMGIWLYEPHNTAIPVKSLEAQTAVTQIAFAPDGNSLAVVSDNDVVKLWHLRTGEIEIAARGMVIRFTPAGKLVVAQYHENGVQVFEDVLSSDKSVVLSTRNEPVMFNRDASILALRTPCCTADMAFQLIDTETKDVLVSQWYIDGYSLAFSPDGLQFAYGLPLPNAPDGHHWSNYTATVVLIESRSGIIINTLKGRGRQSRPNGLTYSSNGELLAVDYSGYDSPDIFIWNINSRSITAILPQSPDNELGLTTPMGFSPDGAVLAVATRDGLQLWKIDLQ